MTITFTPVTQLPESVDLSSFTCDDDYLDRWLINHAKDENTRGRSRTTILHTADYVVGYYALALHTIEPTGLTKAHTGRNRRTESQPGYLLAKLGVNKPYQGHSIGSQLVVSAVRDCLQASDLVGGRVLVVDYQRPELSPFYESLGFTHEAMQGRRVMLLSDARATLAN